MRRNHRVAQEPPSRGSGEGASGMSGWFLGLGSLGIIFSGLTAGYEQKDAGPGLRVFTFSLVIALASGMSGWLLGLLFGCPAALGHKQAGGAPRRESFGQQDDGGDAKGREDAGGQTNLEQIAGFLSVIIVGVGLTWLYFLPGYLWRAAGVLNDHGLQWPGPGQTLVLALCLYFTRAGFGWGT